MPIVSVHLQEVQPCHLKRSELVDPSGQLPFWISTDWKAIFLGDCMRTGTNNTDKLKPLPWEDNTGIKPDNEQFALCAHLESFGDSTPWLQGIQKISKEVSGIFPTFSECVCILHHFALIW